MHQKTLWIGVSLVGLVIVGVPAFKLFVLTWTPELYARYFKPVLGPAEDAAWLKSLLNATSPSNILLQAQVSFENFQDQMPGAVSRDCPGLAKKVIAATEEKLAESGGVLVSHGDLKQIFNKYRNSILCKGVFEGKGDLPSGVYIVSEDKKGVYWKYDPNSFANQIMALPEVQILQQLNAE